MERKYQLIKIVSPISENEDVALKYAKLLEEFFDFLDAGKINDAFSRSVQENDYLSAISECAKYYREKEYPQVEGIIAQGEYDSLLAEKNLNGFAREVSIDWVFENGEIDFLFNPTKQNGPVNHEWLWQFNRHNHWQNFAKAYNSTRDERFAIEFEKQLLKWIKQTDIPQNWNGPDSAWRTIECGLRLLGSWPTAFEGFRTSESVSDLALILMIASMHKQTVHLINHPTVNNWLMMEANGSYTFSALFPEFDDSASNRAISIERLISRLEEQILPDGMHNELSPDYQAVVLLCVTNFYALSKALGTTDEIPNKFVELIEATVLSAIKLTTPAFTQPLTNDTHIINTAFFTSRAEKLFGKKAEYSFVNTNRKEGAPPVSDTASVYLPHAGFAVMRSDWSENATYLCFDVGPLGMCHQHQDMLNINIYKGAQELIYDDGGGQYDYSALRGYAVSGHAHNCVLVDGMAQNRKSPYLYSEPYDALWKTNEVFDYARGVYEDTFGPQLLKPATHKREVRFCKPDFFLVCDTLTSSDEKTHDFELLFHLDTTKVSELPEYKNALVSCFESEYEIAIIPLDEDETEVGAVSASGEPRAFGWDNTNNLRGWFNGRNETVVHASITVSRSVKAKKNFRFNTLLIPFKKDTDSFKVTKIENGVFEVTLNGNVHRINLTALDK